jgi:hypothetical protein
MHVEHLSKLAMEKTTEKEKKNNAEPPDRKTKIEGKNENTAKFKFGFVTLAMRYF